jgi:hypothetical protein
MKTELMNTEKPKNCTFTSSFGIDFLNLLLQRMKEQKKHSQTSAPDQMQYWRERELLVRKCINLAQEFADQL